MIKDKKSSEDLKSQMAGNGTIRFLPVHLMNQMKGTGQGEV